MTDIEFELEEHQRQIYHAIRDFSRDIVGPQARRIDADHYFPAELIGKLGALGFLGVNAPEEFGGSGLDYVSYSIVIEELARWCASTSVVVSAHNSLCLWPIARFGTPEQKERYLPGLASGKLLGCFALSEPGTGSDAARQTCTAQRSGETFVVNGVKNWITNAPVADVCVLFAMEKAELGYKGISAFIVDLKTTSGVSVGKREDKLGICGSPTASITFDNVELPANQLLGESLKGFRIAMETLDGGRLGVAAQATGIARAAFEDAVAYSKQRETFGKPISEHQSIQNLLAEMSTRIHASRLMLRSASKRKDQGLAFTRQAASAKLFASETAMFCADKGIQIHGGYGYVKDFNAERYLRDAKITEIYEGTSEIQRLVIATNVLKES